MPRFKVNRRYDCDCPPDFVGQRVVAHLMAGARRQDYEGRAHLIVPVIMLRSTVPMNGARIPVEEIVPQSWNGVPVTVGHPDQGGFVSANSPEVLSEWSVGRIFEARSDNGILKAEAWIEVARAERIAPGLVESLEAGERIDVSTGYFSRPEPMKGQIGGKPFDHVDRDIKPDHLALLPDEDGACSWADGCGVRFNRKGKRMTEAEKVIDAIKKAVGMKGNERGEDDDFRQMIADLISREESPFMPEDEESLRMMSMDTLTKMRNKFLPKAKEEDKQHMSGNKQERAALVEKITANSDMKADDLEKMEDDTLKVIANGLKEPEKKADEAKANKDEGGNGKARTVADMTPDDLSKMVANAVVAHDEAKERPGLIAQVVANSKITKEEAEAMDTAALRTVANGLKVDLPEPNYGGRAVPLTEDDTKRYEGMLPGSSNEFINNLNGKGAKQ